MNFPWNILHCACRSNMQIIWRKNMFNENANSHCVLTFFRIYVFFVAWWSARYVWSLPNGLWLRFTFFFLFDDTSYFGACDGINIMMVFSSPKAVNFSWGIVLNFSALEWHFDKHGKFLFIPQYSWCDCESLDKMRNKKSRYRFVRKLTIWKLRFF